VGVTGCGKSSLVHAGLLPSLDPHVLPVTVEATAEDTERSLLRKLRAACPELSAAAGLAEAVRLIAQGRCLPPERHKLLLVIDQFEQWLHGHGICEEDPVLGALSRCDGVRVQCLLVVRDDYSDAALSLFGQLEISLDERRNYAVLRPFTEDHARHVLRRFGRHFKKLAASEETAGEEEKFLTRVIHELAHDGEVRPVRLALLIEALRNKPWTTSTIEHRGVAGVIDDYFDECLSGRAPDPR
jgi:hypothetical protein